MPINELKATLNRYPDDSLPTYWERSLRHPYEPAELLSRHETPTQLLTSTERATVRVTVPNPANLVPGNSILHEAAMRCAIWAGRGVLRGVSGHSVARDLESAILRSHPLSLKFAWRGWDLLRLLSAANLGVSVVVAAEPLPGTTQFRFMALDERCAELANSYAERRGSEIR